MSRQRVVRPSRREFLRTGFYGMGLLWAGRHLSACGGSASESAGPSTMRRYQLAELGPLGAPDANGVRLPEGFSARIVARSGQAPIEGHDYRWHNSPDGGACFATDDGGHIYVSNSEFIPGGVGALRFDAEGELVDAYAIAGGNGMILNCAGGPTPWGTWLTCEEHDFGSVWECDPHGERDAEKLPALGVFKHEAVAVDMARRQLYLTEDTGDGRLYRFTSDGMDGDRLDLSKGVLEVAEVMGGDTTGPLRWHEVPEPDGSGTPTREQVPQSTAFRGGEGIWFHDDVVYFTTKGDDRVWSLAVADQQLDLLYDAATSDTPILNGVDNVTVTAGGEVVVSEDGGDMQVLALRSDGTPVAIVQIEGQDDSEITGPAFDPTGTRFYFSSQRGTGSRIGEGGITYEMTGPFFVEEPASED